MIRQGLIAAGLAWVLGTACTVRPLTPPPAVSATLPPAGLAWVTFTPTVTAPATETPVRTEAPAPTLTASPRPAAVDQPQAVSVQAAPATSVPPAPATAAPSEASPTDAPSVVQQPTPVPPPAAPAGDAAAAEQYTIDLINAQRAAAGVPPLARDETLMSIARGRVNDMVARGYTGHNDPVTGAALGKDWMRAAGYTSSYLGENWYGSIKPPPQIVDIAMSWFMTDPPHYRNILSPNYVSVGVGIAYNGRQWLLIQNFAGANAP